MKKKPNPEMIDDENPEWTEAMFKKAKRFADMPADFRRDMLSLRGRPKKENPKAQVSLRLDAEVLEAFKADGAGYQTRINNALREWAQEHGKL